MAPTDARWRRSAVRPQLLARVPEMAETVGNELPSAFHFIRRNDAGHPEIPTNTDPDTVFLKPSSLHGVRAKGRRPD